MNAKQALVHGTLHPDGTLQLDEPPPLAAGPVEVLIRTLPSGPDGVETWWAWLERAHAERVAQGQSCRSKEAIDADRARQRDADDARQRALHDLHSPRE